MPAVDPRLSIRLPLISLLGILLLGFAWMPAASAQAAYVRVSQVGYETGRAPFRAYLMSTVAENEATFKVLNSKGVVAYRGAVGASLGAWSHSKTARYSVYAIDFTTPEATCTKSLFRDQPRRPPQRSPSTLRTNFIPVYF
jgi:hypothetical protein